VIDNAVVDVESSFYPAEDRVCIAQTASWTARDLPFPGATPVSGAVQLFASNITSENAERHDAAAGNAYFGEHSGCSKIG
jgi:hypothetical protein